MGVKMNGSNSQVHDKTALNLCLRVCPEKVDVDRWFGSSRSTVDGVFPPYSFLMGTESEFDDVLTVEDQIKSCTQAHYFRSDQTFRSWNGVSISKIAR